MHLDLQSCGHETGDCLVSRPVFMSSCQSLDASSMAASIIRSQIWLCQARVCVTARASRCSQLFHDGFPGQAMRCLVGGILSLAAENVDSTASTSSGSGERSTCILGMLERFSTWSGASVHNVRAAFDSRWMLLHTLDSTSECFIRAQHS